MIKIENNGLKNYNKSKEGKSMLQELRIENFAIIDDIDIDFSSGMNALIGQTGAGKSVIVQALGLLEGQRSEFSKLKDETKKATIEGVFCLEKAFIAAHSELNEYLDGGNIISVSRILLPSKSSLARINGETVSISQLSQAMSGILDIHSQGSSSLLLDSSNYLALVDAYSPNKELSRLKKELTKAFEEYKKAGEEIDRFKQENDLGQKDFISYQLEEIKKARLHPLEIEDLNAELASLSSYQDLAESFKGFSSFYYAGEDASQVQTFLSTLKSRLSELKGTPIADQASKALDMAEGLSDSLDEIFAAYNRLDFSPQRLEAINARLFYLSGLQHKYGKKTEDILAAQQKFQAKMDAIATYDDSLKSLKEAFDARRKEAEALSGQITKERLQASRRLEKAVGGELTSLGLLADGFRITLAPKELSQDGQDAAVFEVALNKGSKFLLLKEAASGGENSRLMLALKCVFNSLKPYDTLVFDEIDTGISGGIASMVALKIREISKTSMVLVISHLPQVVAAASSHYLVYKNEAEGHTASHIVKIEGTKTVEQIAAMLSGGKTTPAAFQAAQDLIDSYSEESKKS